MLLKFETETSEEIFPRSEKDIWEIKENRGGVDQQVRPPLQDNYVDDGEEIIEEFDDTHINLMGVHDDESIFLTREEQ